MQFISRYNAAAAGLILFSSLQLSCANAAGQNPAATNPASEPASSATSDGSFSNPLLNNGADPWLEYFDGNYYRIEIEPNGRLINFHPLNDGFKDE